MKQKSNMKQKKQAIGATNLEGIKPTTISGILTKRCGEMLIAVIIILRRMYDQAPKKRGTGTGTVTNN